MGTVNRTDCRGERFTGAPDSAGSGSNLLKLESSIAAVVTGAASGLGEATARALAALGVKVGIFDLNVERGQAIARETGGVFGRADVTSDSSVDEAFAQVRAAHGVERILVNCAGGGTAAKI